MADGSDNNFVVEDSPEGRSLIVTGYWSTAAANVLRRGAADGLELNYTRGFCEGSLEFLDSWGVRRLHVLDRGIMDLAPIERLGDSLEDLSVQAAQRAELDLGALPHLASIAGEWAMIGGTLGDVGALQSVITWQFDEVDLHVFRDHFGLQRLTLKEAPHLESLSGVGNLPELALLTVLAAHRLDSISDVDGLELPLRELELESCPAISSIEDVERLVNLRFLGISDCGDIESLWPITALQQLETFHAWGSTRVLDGDLSPLTALSALRDLRMRDRRGYKPRVADIVAALPA